MYKQCETSIIQTPIIRTLVRNFAIFLLDLGDVVVHVNYAELRLSVKLLESVGLTPGYTTAAGYPGVYF